MTVHFNQSIQSLLLERSTEMKKPAHKLWKSCIHWSSGSCGGIFRAIRWPRTSLRRSLSRCSRILKSSAERVRLNTGSVVLQLSLVTNHFGVKNLDRSLNFRNWTWTIPKIFQRPSTPMRWMSNLPSILLNFCKNCLRLSSPAIKWSSAFSISRKNQSLKLPRKRDGAPLKLKLLQCVPGRK